MTATGIIYALKSPSDRFYIGQTIQPLDIRISRHVWEASNGSPSLIHCAIRKYGIEKFKVAFERYPVEQLNQWEVFWIQRANSFESGYNMTSGGDSGFSRDLSAVHTDVFTMYSNGWLVTDIASQLGKSVVTVTGILQQFGVSLDEIRDRGRVISGVHCRSVAQICFTSRVILNVFSSMVEASEITHVNKDGIGDCCANRNNSSGGYFWRYIEDVSASDLLNREYRGSLPAIYGPGKGNLIFDKSEMEKAYYSGLSGNEIAEKLGCSESIVSEYLSTLDIPYEERMEHSYSDRARVVFQYTFEYELIKRHWSLRSAARFLGLTGIAGVRWACETGCPYHGFLWSYKN